MAAGRRKASRVAALLVLLLVQPAEGGARPQGPAEAAGMWLAGDLHVHTCYSHDAYCPPNDDNTGPDELYTLSSTVQEQFCTAGSRDLDFLAITDHNDVRSIADPGFGACGVLPVSGYEISLRGHAQALGARKVYNRGDQSPGAVAELAGSLRSDGGVFQINHPAEGSVHWPEDPDWGYGYDVVPDTVEAWNISTVWQPPAPSGSSNDDAIRYWEGWLDRGHRVGATAGSDNHWKHTQAVHGPGQPTTWVYAADRSAAAILDALRRGRTSISAQPPALGGARLYLEADTDRDGTFESIVGDTVPSGTPMRARVDGAPGSFLRLIVTGGFEAAAPVPVTGATFEHRFAAPASATWIRAEVVAEDLKKERTATCDAHVGGHTTYCRNALSRLAMTSAIFLHSPG